VIRMKFDRGGKVTISPEGYPGKECQNVTAHIRKHMAGSTHSEVPTDESQEPERAYTVAQMNPQEKV